MQTQHSAQWTGLAQRRALLTTLPDAAALIAVLVAIAATPGLLSQRAPSNQDRAFALVCISLSVTPSSRVAAMLAMHRVRECEAAERLLLLPSASKRLGSI